MEGPSEVRTPQHSAPTPVGGTAAAGPSFESLVLQLRASKCRGNQQKLAVQQLSAMAAPATKRVECPSANKQGACPAVLAGDPKATPRGLIVLQEWWGMNQQIQDAAKEISTGVKAVTIVPDLYRGKVTVDNEEAGHLMGSLDWQGAVADIRACAQYLKSQGCTKVGVTGFCMGGALSFAGAALVPEIDAAAPFYGIPSPQLCDVTTIKVPLQCHFAEKDDTKGFASPDEWKPLQTKLEGKIKNLEFFTYDAPHAFTNKTSPNYKKECQEEAFKRMFEFFNKNL